MPYFLLILGKSNEQFGLPEADMNLISLHIIRSPVDEELDRQTAKTRGKLMYDQLNPGQKQAFQAIMKAIVDDRVVNRQFFLDGPGGTGKTHLYNTLTFTLIGEGKKVISTASTGIAATLLRDGTTYHSRFKIYPPITDTTCSKIQDSSYEASLIRNAELIVADEVTMMQFHAIDAIDKICRKIMKKPEIPFGGKVFVFGGDFRQCLPIVPHGNRVKVIQMTIKKSTLWKSFHQLKLTQNMRVSGESAQKHAEWLIQLGDGELNKHPQLGPNTVEIPQCFIIPPHHSEQFMIRHVFEEPANLLQPGMAERICNRAILCPKNKDCLEINNFIINSIPGESTTYKSIDSIDSEDQDEISNFPTEYLKTIYVSGVPPHILTLKVGTVIILLKNIDSRQHLCNGRTISK